MHSKKTDQGVRIVTYNILIRFQCAKLWNSRIKICGLMIVPAILKSINTLYEILHIQETNLDLSKSDLKIVNQS